MKKLVFWALIAIGCQGIPESSRSTDASPDFPNSIDPSTSVHALQSRTSVGRFYELRQGQPFWISTAGLSLSADSVIRVIREAKLFGLDPEDYHLSNIQLLLKDSTNSGRFAQMDLLLTDAWLTMYSHLKEGRMDTRTLQRRDCSQSVNDQAIASLLGSDEKSVIGLLREAEPSSHQYKALKEQLALYLLKDPQNADDEDRVWQLAINMERRRWEGEKPARYVSVNIPSFVLRVFENDSLWMETKVIVGKRETPTPVMQSVIKSFIIYPYWHVPNSISTKEILPHLQVDRTYLRRNNFDVLNKRGEVIFPDTIQWDYYSPTYFPFVLRQREGSENSMGIIKFVFANNYNVYLHDTNSKRLFANARRDLSHGCVRVSNAVAFAHYLVRDDDIYVSPEDLDQYLSLQQRHTIDVRKPITLRLEYFTAEVKDDKALFYDDIYKKDSLMLANLTRQVNTPLGPSPN